MAATYYSDTDKSSKPSGEDRRTYCSVSEDTPKRRMTDRWFNKARWQIVIGVWFVAGLVVLAYLIDALGSR